MGRIVRIGLAITGIAVLGLVVYELLCEAEGVGGPEGETTRFPQHRPPFAEAAETLED